MILEKKRGLLIIMIVVFMCSLIALPIAERETRRMNDNDNIRVIEKTWPSQENATRERSLLAPGDLTATIVDNVNVKLSWSEPTDIIQLSYHNNIAYDAYIQRSDEAYGTVFDLFEYPGATLEFLDFRHSSWDVFGNWEYEILILDWKEQKLLASITDTTTVNDGWETNIDLESLAGVDLVGIFILPLGNEDDDAYPVLDYDDSMNGYSIVIDADDYDDLFVAHGDWLMDLYIRPGRGARAASSDIVAAPRKSLTLPELPRATARGDSLLQYNIYSNGQLITEIPEIETTEYFDTNLMDGIYNYYVTAKYEEGESEPSNIVQVEIIADLEELFYDDFSSYPDFVTTFPPWITIDGDGSTTFGFSSYTFPNEFQAMAWIVFNPFNTNPAMDQRLSPHSGTKMLGSFSSEDNANDNWLIAPRLTLGTDSSLSFHALSYSSEYGLERFRVAISLTDTEPGSFEVIYPVYPIQYEEPPVVWTEYNIDLSDYDNKAVYIAIHCISDRAHAMFLDSFKVSSVGGSNIEETELIPMDISANNYPNPFNPETTIYFNLNAESKVALDIYNVKGQKINNLVDSFKPSGNHKTVWDGRDYNGKEVTSGVYYYRITTETDNLTGKMLLLK